MSKNQKVTKYQRWYEKLCARAKTRDIPTAYTEVHHIKPRSLGGSDDESNLVRLTYREHFLCHWLLTRFHTGLNLHKMQKAFWAVSLTTSGGREVTGWQLEAAKRNVRDMELNEAVDEAWRARRKKKQLEKLIARRLEYEEWQRQMEQEDFDRHLRIEHILWPHVIKILEKNPRYLARRKAVRENPKLLKPRRVPLKMEFRNIPPPIPQLLAENS